MSENRLPDYLDHIQQAATDARSFVEGMARDDFLADKCTQQAVIMSLIVIGEAATKVMDGYAEFTQAHADVPWRSMRNMRNRMAHGYFDINLDVVWETVPPRQNRCRPHRTLNLGAMMEEQVGEIRTSIQGQGRGAVAAA